MTAEERLQILQRHAAELAEIYDSVQLMATFLNPDNTTAIHQTGSGNWCARQYMAQDFIKENSASNLARLIARELNPPDDSLEKK